MSIFTWSPTKKFAVFRGSLEKKNRRQSDLNSRENQDTGRKSRFPVQINDISWGSKPKKAIDVGASTLTPEAR